LIFPKTLYFGGLQLRGTLYNSQLSPSFSNEDLCIQSLYAQDSDGRVGEDDDVVYTGDDDVLFPPGDDGIVGNDDGGDNFNDLLFNDDCDGPCGGGGINVTENLTASEVFDEFNKTYSVFAYQCALEPPHAQVDDIIYQGDNLGVCVETLFRDTFIADVIDLELIQSNGDGVGGLYTTKPVDTNIANVVTE